MSRRARPAPAPRARTPLVYWLGVLWALLLLAGAVVLAQDALVGAGALADSWLATAAARLGEVHPGPWSVPVAVGLAVLGLLLLVVALRPRRTTARRLRAEHDVFLEHRGTARIAADAASHVDGVLGAGAHGGRRSIRVRVDTAGGSDRGVEAEVRRVVQRRLAAVQRPPRVRVRSRPGGRA